MNPRPYREVADVTVLSILIAGAAWYRVETKVFEVSYRTAKEKSDIREVVLRWAKQQWPAQSPIRLSWTQSRSGTHLDVFINGDQLVAQLSLVVRTAKRLPERVMF